MKNEDELIIRKLFQEIRSLWLAPSEEEQEQRKSRSVLGTILQVLLIGFIAYQVLSNKGARRLITAFLGRVALSKLK